MEIKTKSIPYNGGYIDCFESASGLSCLSESYVENPIILSPQEQQVQASLYTFVIILMLIAIYVGNKTKPKRN